MWTIPDITAKSFIKRFPLGTRLVTPTNEYRYVLDKDGYQWITESRYMKNPIHWLRRAKHQITLVDGSIIKL